MIVTTFKINYKWFRFRVTTKKEQIRSDIRALCCLRERSASQENNRHFNNKNIGFVTVDNIMNPKKTFHLKTSEIKSL